MESGGESSGPSRWGRVAREALPLVVLLAVCVKSMSGEWRARDLTCSDETMYLAFVLLMSDPNAAPVESNPLYVPLYVEWYRLLMQLPIAIQYMPFVSHGLLMAALAGLLYALVRRLGTGRWVAVASSSLLILNTQVAWVEPFPVHLATALLALGVLVGTYRRSLLGACGPIGFGILAACYARNEFGTLLLSFLPLYIACGVWTCVRATGRWREFLGWAVPLVAAVGACGCTLGLPLPNGPRALCAFQQHYARNVVEARGGTSMEWDLNYLGIAQADFGEVKTFGEAVRARPDVVAWHVGRNLNQLPTVVSEMCRPRLPLVPKFHTPGLLLVLAALAVGLVGVVRRVRAGGLSGPDGLPLRAVVLGAVCACAVAGPSALLIYPRHHYLILPLFFALVLAVSGLPAPRWPTGWLGAPVGRRVWAAGLIAAALLVAAAPNARNEWTPLRMLRTKWRYEPPEVCESREVMALLHSLPKRPYTVVADYGYFGTIRTLWMAQPVLAVPHFEKAEGFRAFVAKHQIGVVVLDSNLPSAPQFGNDPEFMALWNGTDTGDFVVLTSPGGARIAVRKDLLE